MRIVIIGAGEVGRHLARSLQADADLILIDSSAAAVSEAEDCLDARALVGDGTHRSVLAEAEVHKAELVAAVTAIDSVNLVIAALAKSMGAAQVVARVDDPEFYVTSQGIERQVLGIDAAVCASRLVGVELLRRLAEVRARQVIPCAAGFVHIASHVLGEDSPLVDTSRARGTSWPKSVRAVIRAGSLRPVHQVEHAEVGDVVLLAGSPLTVFEELLGRALTPSSGTTETTIVGGGDVGVQLARLLGPRHLLDRLIERDRARCWALADQLDEVQILHGDGTNLAFLRDEHVGRADALLAVTGSDEANLMTSLLARELGVDHVFALVHRPGYAGVYSHLGVSGTVSPHETVVEVITWLLRSSEAALVGRAHLDGLPVEIVELRLYEDGLKVADLPLPTGSVALLIAGAQLREAKPRAVLSREDHVIVAVPSGRVAKLERDLRRRARRAQGRASLSSLTGGSIPSASAGSSSGSGSGGDAE